jgi:hypothetical protein
MTWFATVSAWAALAMGAMFAINAYFQFATGVSGWVYVAIAALLGLGGFRTLRKMSGGLRLLAGAWGLTAGALLLPFTTAAAPLTDPGALAFLLIALAGLALTITHKEQK